MATYKLEDVLAESTAPAKNTYSLDEVIGKPVKTRSALQELPRQLGLTARHAIQGLADTAGIFTDPLAASANAVGRLITPSGSQQPQFNTLSSSTRNLLDRVGLPSPETSRERNVAEASKMLVGTGGILKSANLAPKALSAITSRPELQAASAVGSGYAGSEAREQGLGGAEQFGASLLGGLGVPIATSTIQSGVGKIRSLINPVTPKSTGNIGLDIARQEGLTVPPSMANPSIPNRLLEGFAGKLSTGQAASMKNQAKLNNLVRNDLGLPKDTPLSQDVLKNLRSDAGDAYDSIKNTGTVIADKDFEKALNNITLKYQGAGKDFPELAKNEAVDIVNSIKVPKFDSNSAVDAIKVLRGNADDAFAKGNKGTGKAYKDAANAIEDLMGRHLQAIGAPDDLVKNYQNARTTIAKTYSVENALNPTTGNIIGSKLAKQLDKKKPLSPGMKKVAQFSQAFPTAAKEITSSMPGLSPLDYATGGLAAAATQNPLLLAATLSRPLARSAILSRPYQSMMTRPSNGQMISPALITPGLLSLDSGLFPKQNSNNQ